MIPMRHASEDAFEGVSIKTRLFPTIKWKILVSKTSLISWNETHVPTKQPNWTTVNNEGSSIGGKPSHSQATSKSTYSCPKLKTMENQISTIEAANTSVVLVVTRLTTTGNAERAGQSCVIDFVIPRLFAKDGPVRSSANLSAIPNRWVIRMTKQMDAAKSTTTIVCCPLQPLLQIEVTLSRETFRYRQSEQTLNFMEVSQRTALSVG